MKKILFGIAVLILAWIFFYMSIVDEQFMILQYVSFLLIIIGGAFSLIGLCEKDKKL